MRPTNSDSINYGQVTRLTGAREMTRTDQRNEVSIHAKEEENIHDNKVMRPGNSDSIYKPVVATVTSDIEMTRIDQRNDEVKIGEKIDDYIICKKLGSGNFGDTYKVRYGSDEFFALKLISCPTDMKFNEAFAEASALGRIHSENVVAFRQTFISKKRAGIVMQYCPDGNLEEVIKKGNVENKRVKEIMLDIARGLDAFHSINMVHRDLKPDNLLLIGKRVLLGDLGLSSNLDPTYQVKRSFVYYTAPEIYKGGGTFKKESDIWSLGCVLLVLLSGKLLENRKGFVVWKLSTINMKKMFTPELEGRPGFLVECLFQCLQHDYSRRPNTQQLIQELSPQQPIQELSPSINPYNTVDIQLS